MWNVFKIKSMRQDASEKLVVAEESLIQVFYGMKTMAECYALLDEHDAAVDPIKNWVEKLGGVELDKARTRARMLEYNEDSPPELPFASVIENRQLFLDRLQELRVAIDSKPEDMAFLIDLQQVSAGD
jgi:hypothetical protein